MHQELWPLFGMWAAMMVAMMAPAEAASLFRLARGRGAYLAGYLAPWIAFSFGAAALQLQLHASGLLDHHRAALTSSWVAAALLVGAGALQISPLKRACLERCRLLPWQGSLQAGLRQGSVSIASCGLLMLVPFAVGVMNLIAMALITALLVAERVAPRGWPVSSVSGGLLAGAGLWLAAF
jgi:predicted metal-binding membrane protein